ncbi:MAG: carbon-nitrogen hydrolase family protein [Desulfobacterales bacterium]
MKIAVYQGEGVGGAVSSALEVMRRYALEAAAQGAGMVIFPEMFLTGYNIGDAVFDLAEPLDGPSAEAVRQIARDTGVSLLYGYPERAGDRVFNSARLIHPAGGATANYRKTHLYGREERRLFQRGDSLIVAETNGLKVGILICYDVEFPEAVRALALAGAELVAVPTALIQPFDVVARILVPARAFENQVFIAYAGMCGREDGLGYCGLSCIVAPDGRDLARAGDDPALLLAEIDVSAISSGQKQNLYTADRHPALYAAPVTRAKDPCGK